jgi:hypothetical protein
MEKKDPKKKFHLKNVVLEVENHIDKLSLHNNFIKEHDKIIKE